MDKTLSNIIEALKDKKKNILNIICMAYIFKNDAQISTSDATKKVKEIRVKASINNEKDSIEGRIEQDCRYFPEKSFFSSIKEFADAVRQNKIIEKYENSKKREVGEVIELLKKHVYNSSVIEPNDNNKTNSHPLNQILFGPPGTGKTYHTINKTVQIIDNDFFEQNKDNRTELKERFKKLKNNGQVVFTTFHQSMSYEEFVEGLKPYEKNGEIFYEVRKGIFRQICEEASLTKKLLIKIDRKEQELTKELFEEFYYNFSETLPCIKENDSKIILKTKEGAEFKLFKKRANSIVVRAGKEKANMSVSCNELINIYFENKPPTYKSYAPIIFNKILENKYFEEQKDNNASKNYVLIIDEINRGNIASIFGELITLIEPDKRKDAEEELYVKLPYSKDEFTVPKNLYIIGTMNTADRSVEALDSALRRRFVFEEMPPNEALLKDDIEDIDLQKLLKQINIRIERLIDKDHKIGHSYFMNLSNIEDLRNAFKHKLIPLLEEYFYGDFVKIGLVLGKSFLNIEKGKDNIFKKIEEYEEDYIDFESRIIYKTIVPQNKAEFINAVKNIYVK